MAYSKDYNYAIKWNAKSGCSYFRKLFLKLHINELESKNVNHHNLQMLFQFPTNIDLNKLLIIELVRNPYSRTVYLDNLNIKNLEIEQINKTVNTKRT